MTVRPLEEKDVEFESMRSGGPGGQHGDRRATAVRLRVPIDELPLTDREKEYVLENLQPKNRTKEDELIVQCGEHRSQKQNRKRALEIAGAEIEQAIQSGKQAKKKEEYKRRTKRRSSGGGGGGEEDIHEKQKKRRRSETTEDLLEEAFEQNPEVVGEYFEDKNLDDESSNRRSEN